MIESKINELKLSNEQLKNIQTDIRIGNAERKADVDAIKRLLEQLVRTQ